MDMSPGCVSVTPLHLAVRLGNMVLLEALLRIEEVVRNINYKGNDGYDAVGAALVLGRTEVLTRLMQLDAVREQLGYEKMHWLGVSYGTHYGYR